MGFLGLEKKEGQEVEDTIKILSTNLEVINQRLDSISGGGSHGKNTQIQYYMENLDKKLNYMLQVIKASQDNMSKQLGYAFNRFNAIIDSLGKTEDNLKKYIELEKKEIMKEFITRQQLTYDATKKVIESDLIQVSKQLQNLNNTVVNVDKRVSTIMKNTGMPGNIIDDMNNKFGNNLETVIGLMVDLIRINKELISREKAKENAK